MTAAQFTFQPGGPSFGCGNTFTTEAALSAAISSTGSSGAVLLFDLSFNGGSTYTFTTVGSLNLGQYTTWVNAGGTNPISINLQFSNGTTLAYPPVSLNASINLVSTQTAPMVQPAAGTYSMNMNSSSISLDSTGGFFDGNTHGATLYLEMSGNSGLGGSAVFNRHCLHLCQ